MPQFKLKDGRELEILDNGINSDSELFSITERQTTQPRGVLGLRMLLRKVFVQSHIHAQDMAQVIDTRAAA